MLSKQLLERMEELRERHGRFIEDLVDLPGDVPPECADALDACFRDLVEVRTSFQGMSGFQKGTLEYSSAAHIYRGLLEPVLLYAPEKRREIKEIFTYF